MTSDTKQWDVLHARIRDINKQLQDAKAFAEDNDLVVAIGEDGWLSSFGRGEKEVYDFITDTVGPSVEVWQDSSSCSEQGFSTFAEIDWARPITKVPDE